jgi:hypothetical protein
MYLWWLQGTKIASSNLSIMNSTTSHILVAAGFCILGFILARVTMSPPPMEKATVFDGMITGAMEGLNGDGHVQVIVKSLESSDFQGDTVFAIPGGEVHIEKQGDDVEVDVIMTEGDANEWIEKSTEGTVVKKRIVVTSED